MSSPLRLERVTMVDDGHLADIDHGGEAGQSAGARFDRVAGDLRRHAAGRPLTALLAAMGIGLAMGLLSPRR